MHRRQAAVAPGLALMLVAAGCGDSTPVAPTAPSVVQAVPAAALDAGPAPEPAGRGAMNASSIDVPGASDFAAADGVTLKADAPQPVSPTGNEETADVRVTLVAGNTVARYAPDQPVPFLYHFEISTNGSTPVHEETVAQGVDTTSYDVPQRLDNDVQYRWRVRAVYDYQGARHAGPWSEHATFRTPPASIAPPIPTGPADGAADVWPVVLQVTNGETSGRVGRVVMTFEVATEPAFGAGSRVAEVNRAAGSGTTRVELPAAGLEPETTYHWRVIARDDLGTASDFSATFSFTTSPVTIAPPIPTAPAFGAADVRPPITLEVANGATRGPVGAVTMTFEIATDDEFRPDTLVGDPIDQPAGRDNRTSVRPTQELEEETTYHWRVIARDDKGHESGYSTISWFTTAKASVPGSGADEIDVAEVTWLHTNVGGWPATSTVTNVRIRDVPAGGICIEHTKANAWPGTRTQGGSNLAGNPWVFGNVGGRWYAATYEWLRPGQICKLTVSGGHKRPSRELGPHIKRPPLDNWVPRSGDKVGFMVSTPARFGPEGPVRERSNIVVVTWP